MRIFHEPKPHAAAQPPQASQRALRSVRQFARALPRRRPAERTARGRAFASRELARAEAERAAEKRGPDSTR